MKNWRGDSAAKPARDWRKPGASADIADTIRLERQSILNHTWKETEKPSPKSISCLKKTPLPAKRWGFCATKSLLFLISFPRLQIPGYSNTIWQICFTGTLLDHLKKVNSNSLFCTTHGFHCLHLGLKSFPSADCMQSQLTDSSHRSSNYWPSNIYTPRIHLKANTLKILHLFYPQPFYSRNPLHCKEPTESMLTSVQTEEPEISNQPIMSLS